MYYIYENNKQRTKDKSLKWWVKNGEKNMYFLRHVWHVKLPEEDRAETNVFFFSDILVKNFSFYSNFPI